MRLHTLRQLLTAPILLAATASCYNYDQEDIIDIATNQYINVTISVTASEVSATRAPLGGEYGDGIERGIDVRENKVNNITLIFYKDEDGKGINTTSDDSKVLFVKKYAVHKAEEGELPDRHTHKDSEPAYVRTNEIIYTTGDQKMEETSLEAGKTYKMLVVANADVNIPADAKVMDIRDNVLSTVYANNGKGNVAKDFVMTSENDVSVTLNNPTIKKAENKAIYYLDCLHIERLAARIDYFAKTKDPVASTYTEAQYDGTHYDHAGYVYNVGPKDGDKQDHFVLTSITPFNVMNGNEYIFKRTNDSTNPYLADETTQNWVLDPYSALTGGKNGTAHPDYLVSKLADVKENMANDYNIILSTCQTASTETTEGTKFSITDNGVTADNIIIGYPKENTLNGNITPLYYYATGLAFEGYYYKKNAATDNGKFTGGTRKVFYHYLRHQGESDNAYSAHTNETLSTTATCPSSPAMNFGIVRNNIYRVSIESITPDNNDLHVRLLIKVKKWDKFVHTPIYM